MGTESRVIAVAFALAAFAVAVVAGLCADLGAADALGRGLLALIVCHILGTGLGAVLQHVIEEHDAVYRASNPVPRVSHAASDDKAAAVEDHPTEVARAA